MLERARSLHRERGDVENEVVTLVQLSSVLYNQGRFGDARAALEESLPILMASGYKYRQAVTMGNLGSLYLADGEIGMAHHYLVEGLALSVEVGDKESIVAARVALGDLHRRTGDLFAAEAELRQALEIAAEVGMTAYSSEALVHLALVAADAGDLAAAREHAVAAIGAARLAESPASEAGALLATGRIELRAGNPGAAEEPLQAALALASELGQDNRGRETAAALAVCAPCRAAAGPRRRRWSNRCSSTSMARASTARRRRRRSARTAGACCRGSATLAPRSRSTPGRRCSIEWPWPSTTPSCAPVPSSVCRHRLHCGRRSTGAPAWPATPDAVTTTEVVWMTTRDEVSPDGASALRRRTGEHGARRVAHHVIRHRTEHRPAQPTSAAGAEHDHRRLDRPRMVAQGRSRRARQHDRLGARRAPASSGPSAGSARRWPGDRRAARRLRPPTSHLRRVLNRRRARGRAPRSPSPARPDREARAPPNPRSTPRERDRIRRCTAARSTPSTDRATRCTTALAGTGSVRVGGGLERCRRRRPSVERDGAAPGAADRAAPDHRRTLRSPGRRLLRRPPRQRLLRGVQLAPVIVARGGRRSSGPCTSCPRLR